jgi:hypothetical protein
LVKNTSPQGVFTLNWIAHDVIQITHQQDKCFGLDLADLGEGGRDFLRRSESRAPNICAAISVSRQKTGCDTFVGWNSTGHTRGRG